MYLIINNSIVLKSDGHLNKIIYEQIKFTLLLFLFIFHFGFLEAEQGIQYNKVIIKKTLNLIK